MDGKGIVTSAAEGSIATAPLGVRWHGAFWTHHSLALVNRRVTGLLSGDPALQVELAPRGVAAFRAGRAGDETPELLAAAARRPSTRAADIEITHDWPPVLNPPGGGRWVAFQPWEYGSMPVEWLAPFRDRADDVWVYSQLNRRCYLEDGLDPERVHVVPLGAGAAFAPDARPLPQVTQATRKTFRFLFVGGTIHRKGIDIVLEAWAAAFKRTDDVCLVIKDFCREGAYAGQTADERIRRFAAHPDVGEIIYLTDDLPVRDLPSLYTSCHALVHPYRGEGFALPVVEAMACGLTPIVPRGGSTDDFCREGMAILLPAKRRLQGTPFPTVRPAWVLDPPVDQLSAMMKLAVAHRERVREMGVRASAHVRQNFTWERTAANIAARLALVASRPRREKQ